MLLQRILLLTAHYDKKNEISQSESLHLLSKVASKLLVLNGTARFPSCIVDYDYKLPENIRRSGMAFLMEQLISKPYSEWDENFINDRRYTLTTIWKTEKDVNIRSFAGCCLNHMYKLWGDDINRELYWSYGTDEWIKCTELVEELNKQCGHEHVDEYYRKLLKQIEDWVNIGITASTKKKVKK